MFNFFAKRKQAKILQEQKHFIGDYANTLIDNFTNFLSDFIFDNPSLCIEEEEREKIYDFKLQKDEKSFCIEYKIPNNVPNSDLFEIIENILEADQCIIVENSEEFEDKIIQLAETDCLEDCFNEPLKIEIVFYKNKHILQFNGTIKN